MSVIFFQAEDGIRDLTVTGVQTCALPISRVGATDVVPFVPIRGVTMEDCVALARRVGERIGRELNIPVFLYAQAASHPDRANLEALRRGGLDGLAGRMTTDPAAAPEFGPRALHP